MKVWEKITMFTSKFYLFNIGCHYIWNTSPVCYKLLVAKLNDNKIAIWKMGYGLKIQKYANKNLAVSCTIAGFGWVNYWQKIFYLLNSPSRTLHHLVILVCYTNNLMSISLSIRFKPISFERLCKIHNDTENIAIL